MNKRVVIISLLGLITASLAFAFFRPATSPQSVKQQTANIPASQQQNVPPAQDANPGAYITYSETAVAEARGQKVLFFHAPWCSQCRSIESGIQSQGVPAGITIIKVDFDTNQALRQKYGVTLQTTFIKINEQGEFINKYVAYDEPTFDAVKRNFL